MPKFDEIVQKSFIMELCKIANLAKMANEDNLPEDAEEMMEEGTDDSPENEEIPVEGSEGY